MRKKKSFSKVKENKVNDKGNFLKRFVIKEHDEHVRFELFVDSLKIICVCKYHDLQDTDGKMLQIMGWQFSVNSHKYAYCIHLLLMYIKSYATLNKLTLFAEIPYFNTPESAMTDKEKAQRNALLKLYQDHEFEAIDEGNPQRFYSMAIPEIPKKVDFLGMYYGDTNHMVLTNANAHHHHEKPVVEEPVVLEEQKSGSDEQHTQL